MIDGKQKLTVWGRVFELDIAFDCFPDEDILEIQNEALKRLLASSCINEAEIAVKEYCLKENRDDIQEDNIENIFRYVIPKSIYVARDAEKRVVALLCDYKFDMEHGLAVVFENECLQEIGMQDIIL